jgi:hypothetical protein
MVVAMQVHMVRVMVALISLVLTTALSSSSYRASVIARAKVWQPVDVRAMDLKKGPSSPKAFALGETINCTYVIAKLGGKTPKFACRNADNPQLKVKFGGDNGEVYAEVMASRLLWALGFGADHIYSVRVVCRDCPASFEGVERSDDVFVFDPAAVEHKMPGAAFEPGEDWSWQELDLVDERAGGDCPEFRV